MNVLLALIQHWQLQVSEQVIKEIESFPIQVKIPKG